MRIGELAERTAVTPRMLRYYEKRGLITPHREDNGYRDYGEHLVDRVLKIRGLMETGIPLRAIKDMLPCLDQPQEIQVSEPEPELREMLLHERDRMTERIRFLQHNHESLTRYIEAMDRALDSSSDHA